MDGLLILIAFALGFAAHICRLPPLVGYLAAGFVLNAMGIEGGEVLDLFAEFGVTLLLFVIGLKLRVGDLLRREAWALTTVQMVVCLAAFSMLTLVLSALGLTAFSGLDWDSALLVAFALSFSSTVFAVKALEGRGDAGSLHGRTAVAILIVQDLFAIIFLTFTVGQLPGPWAFLLLGLPLLRPLLARLLQHTGHGELLILFGLSIAAAGSGLFELVGLKGDLGALIFGMLLTGLPRAGELAKSLLGFKDVFLVGFFLSIGLLGLPDANDLGAALLLLLLLPLKTMLFFWLLIRFHLRARTAAIAGMTLSTYSEFGLIVGALSVDQGWMTNEWLVIIAVAIALSFIVAAPANKRARQLYEAWRSRLRPLETKQCLPYDQPIDTGDATVLIAGMGRLGTQAYDALGERHGLIALGIDREESVVALERAEGRNVVVGDPTDIAFWERIREPHSINLVMLAMPNHSTNLAAIDEIKHWNPDCPIAAVARFDDEMDRLIAAGASASYNFYEQAGCGLVESITTQLDIPLRAAES